MTTEIGETLYAPSRAEWRSWLEGNFASKDEIWFLFPKKASGKPAVTYNDAVEEALCFCWIDSTVKSYDENHKAQRFTPRKPKSGYSQMNIERLRWLSKQGMIHPDIVPKVKDVIASKFEFADDIIGALKSDPEVWRNFETYSPSYRRIRVGYVERERCNPEVFAKRLENLIAKTRQNKQFGYGGIEKYF